MSEYYCIECEQLVELEREDSALCAKCEQAESDEMSKDDYQAGWEHSQARIIKLLEDDLCGGGKPALSDDEHCEHDEQTLHLIALIKGEK